MYFRMRPEEFFDKCLLIKYGETDFDVFGKKMDCYGMVYWFYRLCLSINLQKAHVTKLQDAELDRYEKVDVPQNGDIVYMEPLLNNGIPHVGILWGGIVYHFTHEGLRAHKHMVMLNIIKGYYRYVDARKDS